MKTLKNLKISKTKNLLPNKIKNSNANEKLFKNLNQYSNFITINRHKNLQNLQNFHFCDFLKNSETENFKKEIPYPNKYDAINFSLLYNHETKTNNFQKIFEKLNSKNEEEISESKKNLFHKALSDISKRFPLGENYSIDFFEKIIREKYYENYEPRKNIEKFNNEIVEKSTELTEIVNEISAFYEKDDKKNFIESFKKLVSAFNNKAQELEKDKENPQIFLAENYLELIEYLKRLCNHEEHLLYKENLFNINSLLMIKLINELQIIIMELLGETSEITFTSFKKFGNLISEIMNKFNYSDFSLEKNNTFTEDNNILFDNKNYFEQENFLSKNLIFYMTNCIGFIKRTKENNSVELGKYYFLLSLIYLKSKNFEKVEDYNEKINEIFIYNSEKISDKNSGEFYENKLNNIYNTYLKSFLVSIFTSNKKEQFSLWKQTSILIEKLEADFYEAENKNLNLSKNYSIEKDYNLSAIKFKVNSSLGIMYEQYGFLLDAQNSFENSLKINPFFLKSNKNLLMEYFLISDILIEKIYNLFNLFRPKYDLSKKNFNLAFYIINDKQNQEKNSKMEKYAENIVDLIAQSKDNFNLVNMLNPKSKKFLHIKTQQENFILSLINYFQENKNDYATAKIFKEYLNTLYELDTNQEENFMNAINLLNNFKINSNVKNKNPQEILENLNAVKDSLRIEEFMNEEYKIFERKALNKQETVIPEENKSEENEIQNEENENISVKKLENLRENKILYENWINLGITIYYNILINEIKCNQYTEAKDKIIFLINFINLQNENKTIGSVIDHPYLLINLNLLAVHYHLIKNQKIYSVPYLRAVNSMLVKYDWGENTKIKSYLKEMVELIKTI